MSLSKYRCSLTTWSTQVIHQKNRIMGTLRSEHLSSNSEKSLQEMLSSSKVSVPMSWDRTQELGSHVSKSLINDLFSTAQLPALLKSAELSATAQL